MQREHLSNFNIISNTSNTPHTSNTSNTSSASGTTPGGPGHSRLMLILNLLMLTLTVLWMAFIFFMSAAQKTESDEMSSSVEYVLCSIFIPEFDQMPPERQQEIIERLSCPIRKAAHMTEYAILAILLFADIRLITTLDPRNTALLSLILSAIYAASDEYHQLFVPGRSGKITDILIDSAGAATALLLILFLTRLKKQSDHKSKK